MGELRSVEIGGQGAYQFHIRKQQGAQAFALPGELSYVLDQKIKGFFQSLLRLMTVVEYAVSMAADINAARSLDAFSD